MHVYYIRKRVALRRLYFLVVGLSFFAACVTFYVLTPKHPIQPFYCWDVPVPEVPVNEYSDSFVPNIVHFIRLGDDPLSFIEVVSIRAAWLQQNPDILMIHCDNCTATLRSPNWEHIKDISRLTLKYIDRPKTIFGIKVSWIQHASDIARIRVLRKYGGIYLDKDSYLVRNLNKYRRYETTIGWPPGQSIGSMIIVAHKRSEFLRLYYESYHQYRPDLWYYNAGELPTREILGPKPELVYRIPCEFGVHEDVTRVLYEQCNHDWRNFTAVHFFFRLRSFYCPFDKFGPVDFETIGKYGTNFGQMARLVLTGSTKIGGSTVKNITLLSADKLDYSHGCR